MKVPVPNSRSRVVLFLTCCAGALILVFFAVRNAVAAYYVGLDTRAGYERAARLEPHNPRNRYLLGRSYLYDFDRPDPSLAVDSLSKAVALDPYSTEAMLDLATAYEGEGDVARARAAYVSAQRVYPLSADVSWSYGNFLLRQGENDAAYRQLHTALQLDPKRSAEGFSRAFNATSDAEAILEKMVPPTPDCYLPILQLVADQGEVRQLVWNRLVALHPKVPMRDMVVFFDALIHDRRTDEAARLWPQAVSIMLNPPPPDPEGSIVWDGSFESGYSGGAFSWMFKRYERNVQIGWDSAEKHSGQQSLRFLFSGNENLAFRDGCHQIVPDPGQNYLLTGWVKTQSLTSSEGLRLEVSAFTATGAPPVLTDEVHGTHDWTEITARWRAPQDAGLGGVCAIRLMSDMPGSDIQGAAWLDDVSLVPLPPSEKQVPSRP